MLRPWFTYKTGAADNGTDTLLIKAPITLWYYPAATNTILYQRRSTLVKSELNNVFFVW